MPDDSRQQRPIWERILGSAGIVAVITGLVAFLPSWSDDDLERCKLATEFLLDDKKDADILTAEEWKDVTLTYIEIAERHCGD